MSFLEKNINTIINGNCYELIKSIPDKSIDLIVTDPPYDLETSEKITDNEIGRTFKNCNEQLKEINEGIDLKILDEFIRVMKKPNIYIWCNKKQIIEYLNYFVTKHECSFEILTWCKTNPIPLCGGNYLIDKEFCLYFRKNVKLNTKYKTASTYWITKKETDKKEFLHPSIKPLKIIKTLIENSSNENDIVFDPFSGSGTTCMAAKETNRNYIGIEIKEKWHKISVDRLNGISANGQMSIFTDFNNI